MYVGIDIGGSKILAASLDDNGVILQKVRIPTPKQYDDFLVELKKAVKDFGDHDFHGAGVAVPGRIDRKHGIGRVFGNLPWRDVPIQHDIEKILHCPVVLEHDPSLAALSEAMLIKHIDKVLYVTISTGIGAGLVVGGKIDANFAGSEAGQMIIEHQDKLVSWESFAAGSAVVRRYGKFAQDIPVRDTATWHAIARDISRGLIELIALTEPDIIVIGGSVGIYFDRYQKFLVAELDKFASPLVPIPPIKSAERPDEAVLYGCYDLAKSLYHPEIHHRIPRAV
ncbi:MAG TPA: ROK family protein [Candidatus Saccharimonadales bacterium]|jgi:glucokinase